MTGTSKLTPQNRIWEADLPDRCAPVDAEHEKPALYGNLNHLSEAYMEVSRAENVMRGAGLIGGAIALIVLPYLLYLVGTMELTRPNGDLDSTLVFAWLFGCCLALGSLFYFRLPFRMEFTRPRDEPVRFNRKTGKVYVYEFEWNWNPFGRWRPVTKVFDWQTIEAEITKQVGSTGRVVMVRYGLDLASCKPGTTEVADRFTLKGGLWTTAELHRIWAYVRAYMNEGVDAVPSYKPRDQTVSLHQSFVYWFAFIDWTEAGRAYRAKIGPFWSLIHILILLLMPLFIPMVFGHYIATKFAPEPSWPADIDAESRSGESA